MLGIIVRKDYGVNYGLIEDVGGGYRGKFYKYIMHYENINDETVDIFIEDPSKVYVTEVKTNIVDIIEDAFEYFNSEKYGLREVKFEGSFVEATRRLLKDELDYLVFDLAIY